MENKSHALMAGVFTIALLLAAVLIGIWFNRDRVQAVPYQIVTKLSIPGLNPQAAVRYRGLEIGKVNAIMFDPKVPGQIAIQISVSPDTPVTKSTFSTLGHQGVTGIAYVQLDDDGSQPVKLNSSADHIANIEMRPGTLEALESRGIEILNQVDQMTKSINALLAPDNQKAVIDSFNSLNRTATEFERVPQRLQPVLAKLPAITDQAQQTLNSLSMLAKDANRLTGSLNAMASQLQAPEGALAKISGSADEVALGTVPRVNALANEARSTMRTLDRTLNGFNQHPQSILFGTPGIAPGPGEPGFTAPAQ